MCINDLNHNHCIKLNQTNNQINLKKMIKYMFTNTYSTKN